MYQSIIFKKVSRGCAPPWSIPQHVFRDFWNYFSLKCEAGSFATKTKHQFWKLIFSFFFYWFLLVYK